MRSTPFSLADPATWPRLVRNGAGVAWVAGILALTVLVWHAPQRAYHAMICSFALEGAPSWSPDGQRIVFAKESTCSSALFVVDRDGSHLRRLAETRSRDELPVWSPDGRTIAFVGEHSIGSMRPDGTGRRRISRDDTDFGLSWSPDGRSFAYTHGTLPGEGADDLETSLLILSADGARRRMVLRHTVGPGTPAWSPDGRRLAFTGKDGVYVIGVDGRHLTRVWEAHYGTNPIAPAWSPDGRTLSLVDDQGVQLIDIQTHRWLRSIRRDGAHWGDATSWSSDGTWIAFSISGGKRPGIYVMRPDGRGLHRVTPF